MKDEENQGPERVRRSRVARFNSWVRRSPPVILVGLVLFLFVLVSQAIRDGGAALSWYRRTYEWRSVEYARLAHLHSDLTLAAFEKQLGDPLYETQSYDHRWTQYLFQRRTYWVQAITVNGGNTVGAFAVTTCDRSFQPTFYAFGGRIVLNRSHLADLREVGPASFEYTLPADESPWFYAMIGGARASNFQSFAWGEDGACPSVPPGPRFKPGKGMSPYQGQVALRRVSETFSQSLVVNTFAEWGPTELSWPSKSFHIGVDEFRVHALSNSSPPHR